MNREIDPISFQLGQMSVKQTDFETRSAVDRIAAESERKRLDGVEEKVNNVTAKIGVAMLILFGAFQLIWAGVSMFGSEIKAAFHTFFHGGP